MTTPNNQYFYSKSTKSKPSFTSGSSNKADSSSSKPYAKKQIEPKENSEPITPDGIYLYDKDYTHYTVNYQKTKNYDVYIGRRNPTIPSTNNYKYGNPFVVGKDGDRNMVVKKYRDWIFHPDQDKLFKQVKSELKGKILACWCAPLNCHGYILSEIANNSQVTNEQQILTSPINNTVTTSTTTTTTTLSNDDFPPLSSSKK